MTEAKAIFLEPPGGLDRLIAATAECRPPGPGEITVRIHASSLNYHDFGAVTRGVGSVRRIPMSDGARVVTEVGAEVKEFSVGDHVVSTFFPTWIEGEPGLSDFATVPGDGVDGFARESCHDAGDGLHARAGELQPRRGCDVDDG